MTTPKQPTDRQPKKSETIAADAAPPAGHELLKPVETLRSREQINVQADLMELFTELGIDMDATDAGADAAQDIAMTPSAIRAIGRVADILERNLADGNEEAFVAFDTGRGAMTRTMDLAMWYMAQLGESDSSAS